MNSCCASSSLPGAAPAASSSTLNARPPSWKSSASVFAITFLICGFNKAGLCCYRSRRDPEPKKLCAALQPDGRWWQIVAQHCFQTSRYPSKCPFIAAEWTKLLWTQWGGSLGRCSGSDRREGVDTETEEEAGTTSWFWYLIFSVYESAWERWMDVTEHLQPSLWHKYGCFSPAQSETIRTR